MFKHALYLMLFTLSSASLLSCGGGGGSDGGNNGGNGGENTQSPAVASEPSLSFVQSKVFRFQWTDVADATFYRLLENSDGGSGFAQVGGDITQSTEVFDFTVPLYMRLNAQYILQSCNGVGCTDSATVMVNNSLVAAIGYLKASNTQAGDSFGSAVSLSGDGNTLAVGADAEDSSGMDSGAVYIFTLSGGTWNQQAYLKPSNTDAFDDFGEALSLSTDGNTLAVGAALEDSNAIDINGDQADNTAVNSGAVYVFTRNVNIWSQQVYLKASNTGASDNFGIAVSLSADGNTLAVGAIGEDSNATGVDGNQADTPLTGSTSGAVYLFTRSSGTWNQQAYLKASNTDVLDLFGRALSLSADGNTLAVSAPHEDSNATDVNGDQTDNTAVNSGAVYIFTRSDSLWDQQAYLKASNTGVGAGFGGALSMSADGNTLAVGALGEGGNASGAVYVFTRSDSLWDPQAYLKASNADENDWFGFALSLSPDGTTLAVGAHQEASNSLGINGDQTDNTAGDSGAVYVFTRNGVFWNQQAYLKASNTEVDDNFGYALSLSADGTTLAVGADSEDSNATSVGGDQMNNLATFSGAAYLY